jgi:hypothetical protein
MEQTLTAMLPHIPNLIRQSILRQVSYLRRVTALDPVRHPQQAGILTLGATITTKLNPHRPPATLPKPAQESALTAVANTTAAGAILAIAQQ